MQIKVDIRILFNTKYTTRLVSSYLSNRIASKSLSSASATRSRIGWTNNRRRDVRTSFRNATRPWGRLQPTLASSTNASNAASTSTSALGRGRLGLVWTTTLTANLLFNVILLVLYLSTALIIPTHCSHLHTLTHSPTPSPSHSPTHPLHLPPTHPLHLPPTHPLHLPHSHYQSHSRYIISHT